MGVARAAGSILIIFGLCVLIFCFCVYEYQMSWDGKVEYRDGQIIQYYANPEVVKLMIFGMGGGVVLTALGIIVIWYNVPPDRK
ncbi:MAG TPA: hypothetical protein VMW26_04150 [Methanomassiliicoccales archaeon]|nr:hypothetical protein [Methanomassiliicoccales archaeon]